jgi:hypothetical protein
MQTVSTTMVLLAGENVDERQWLAMVISRDSRMLLVGEAGGWQEVLDAMTALSPHVVLLDVDTLGDVPTDGLSRLAEEFSRTALVGLCQDEECRAEVLPHLDLVLSKDVPFDSLLGVVLEISATRGQVLPITEDQPAELPGVIVTECPQDLAVPAMHDGPENDPKSTSIVSFPFAAGPQEVPLTTDLEQQGVEPGGPGRWELRRGTIRLTVHPFRSFRSMLWFQGVLQQVDGVTNSKICLIRDGTLHLTVEYRGLVPIEERLEGLKQFEPAISATDSGCIDLRLGKAVSPRVTSLREPTAQGPMDYVLVS